MDPHEGDVALPFAAIASRFNWGGPRGHRTWRARARRARAGRRRRSAGRATTIRVGRGGTEASCVSAGLAGHRRSLVGTVVESEPISLWPEE
jgi:hypothetical protein